MGHSANNDGVKLEQEQIDQNNKIIAEKREALTSERMSIIRNAGEQDWGTDS